MAAVAVEKLLQALEMLEDHLQGPRAPPPRVHLRLRLGLGQQGAHESELKAYLFVSSLGGLFCMG